MLIYIILTMDNRILIGNNCEARVAEQILLHSCKFIQIK
jgi:hypothetical protein